MGLFALLISGGGRQRRAALAGSALGWGQRLTATDDGEQRLGGTGSAVTAGQLWPAVERQCWVGAPASQGTYVLLLPSPLFYCGWVGTFHLGLAAFTVLRRFLDLSSTSVPCACWDILTPERHSARSSSSCFGLWLSATPLGRSVHAHSKSGSDCHIRRTSGCARSAPPAQSRRGYRGSTAALVSCRNIWMREDLVGARTTATVVEQKFTKMNYRAA